MRNKIAHLTPDEFEEHVQNIIICSGINLSDFNVQRREKILGSDGEYEIDVTARFSALNTSFLVLIECKHHKHPIKREVIQILRDRLDSVEAQKGMLFSSVKFQSGAIEYAKAHNIALVKVTDSDPVYFARAGDDFDHKTIPTRKGGWLVSLNEQNNTTYTLLEMGDPHVILNQLGFSERAHIGQELGRIETEHEP